MLTHAATRLRPTQSLCLVLQPQRGGRTPESGRARSVPHTGVRPAHVLAFARREKPRQNLGLSATKRLPIACVRIRVRGAPPGADRHYFSRVKRLPGLKFGRAHRDRVIASS